uniref:CBM21 domain-containing protein n=1 Tax=Esox lucius TaxID=8010 RepID=A0AAY5KI04_ESOLU
MSFLTIPPRKGLFTTVKNEGSKGRAECYDEGQCNSDEEFEESEETNVRLIPRSSPIPRKRGQSIYDETAEYLKIKDAITSRRVSFADTIGGDLAHVKEFIQFDSDDENDSRWEEEEAKYRPKISEPTYRVSPEWTTPTATALTKSVHLNKVEVESVSPIEDEPLAFIVFVRVLNISFKKIVCVRSTMDNWSNYFDCPAEYVQGDGETDTFSFKLSFCPPYLHHGARIEFVVRYETPDGDYWANNFHKNYAVTLKRPNRVSME